MAECELKNLLGSQSVAGQDAMGSPQPSGRGAPAEMSDGMALRGKNQTEMPLSTHCTARRASQCPGRNKHRERGEDALA